MVRYGEAATKKVRVRVAVYRIVMGGNMGTIPHHATIILVITDRALVKKKPPQNLSIYGGGISNGLGHRGSYRIQTGDPGANTKYKA